MANQNLILKQRYNLHNSGEVRSAAERTRLRTGEKVPQDPDAQIQNYLDRFSEIIQRPDEKDRERGIKALKKLAHDKFVTKYENISESFWELQEKIKRERGEESDYKYLNEEEKDQGKRELADGLLNDQKGSLDIWIDFLASKESSYMPDYVRYWVFRSVVGLQEYDKDNKIFPKRSKGTIKMFPYLNQEALAYVIDAVLKKHKDIPFSFGEMGGKLSEEQKEQFKNGLSSENFGKLYAWALEQIKPVSENLLQQVEGKWIRYKQGSDPEPLIASIEDKNTGWCIVSEFMAMGHLFNGDILIYYSNDKEGKPTIPRIAIDMAYDGSLIQINGVAKGKNLEPIMEGILREKLDEFPNKERFLKRLEDLNRVTELENKIKQGVELSKEELRFIYELDSPIDVFGDSIDPRIKELILKRDVGADLALALDIDPSRISFSEDEALNGNIFYHYGDLFINNGNYYASDKLNLAVGITLPRVVRGDLEIRGLRSAEGLILPESVGGNLDLRSLETTDGLILPETLGGVLFYRSIPEDEIEKLKIKYPKLRVKKLESADYYSFGEFDAFDIF